MDAEKPFGKEANLGFTVSTEVDGIAIAVDLLPYGPEFRATIRLLLSTCVLSQRDRSFMPSQLWRSYPV